jgi:hypothetical protein
MGVNLGTIASNTVRNLGATLGSGGSDADGWTKTARTGMGDIEVSEDGNKIWFVNLFEKKIHSIDITDYNNTGTKPNNSKVSGFLIPDPNCTGGNARPWAMKIKDGKVYVGVICDAFNSQNGGDLRAYVYRFDPSNSTWATVFDFPLTYPKGYAHGNYLDRTNWKPWTDDFYTKAISAGGTLYNMTYPEPILTDIEFDIDGTLLLGFGDRTGMQTGWAQTDNIGASVVWGQSSGDLLRAKYTSGSYILENNGQVAGTIGVGMNNNQGPGFGEFYDDNWFLYDSGTYKIGHSENILGGLAIRPGSGEVVVSAFDPVNMPNMPSNGADYWHSGGVRTLNNTNGTVTRSAKFYSESVTTFGKSGGIGDIELLCASPTYLQIGNYVWLDADKDGVQDACETPMNGVKVSLYKDVAGTLTKIAETTTSANGEYYFSSKSKLSTTWTGTGVDTTLLPTQTYKIVFGETQYTTGKLTISGTNYTLTTKDATTNTGNDQSDSDASEMSITGTMYPSIAVTTGAAGSVNHTFDIGFSNCPSITNPSTTQTICAGSAGANITVNTDQNTANSIKFVKFTTDKSLTNGSETTTELTAIYAGTAIGTAVTPSGASSPYTATYTWNSTDFPNTGTTQLTYYVYAVLTNGVSCQPVQEIKIVVNPLPSFTFASTNVTCYGAADGSLTITTTSGTAPFQYSKNDGTTFISNGGIFNGLTPANYQPTIRDANGCIKKCY